LYPEELEQYELAIEEQAYPFEEKAISVHESNLKLIARGVYNQWIDKSLRKLAVFMPARYDKPEASSDIVASLESYTFAFARPTPVVPPAAGAQPAGTGQTKPAETAGEPAADAAAETDGPVQAADPSANTAADAAPVSEGQPAADIPVESDKQIQAQKSATVSVAAAAH
jgi:cellulose synthase operon protein C